MFAVIDMITNKLLHRLALYTWLLLCVSALVAFLGYSRPGTGSEAVVLLQFRMFVLTFPSGYVAGLFVGAIFSGLSNIGLELPLAVNHYGSAALTWFFMVIAGWLQWFVWLPNLLLRVKSMRKIPGD